MDISTAYFRQHQMHQTKQLRRYLEDFSAFIGKYVMTMSIIVIFMLITSDPYGHATLVKWLCHFFPPDNHSRDCVIESNIANVMVFNSKFWELRKFKVRHRSPIQMCSLEMVCGAHSKPCIDHIMNCYNREK